MNILFISGSANWHVDLWVKHFTLHHKVYLFSDKENYLSDQPFDNVIIIKSEGYLGKVLNFFNIKSHFLFQLNKLVSARYFAARVDSVIQEFDIEIVHAHSLYYGFLASHIKSDVPIVFTPMGSDVIIHSQNSYTYKYMAKKAFSGADIVTGDSVLLQNRGYNVGARSENNFIIQNGVDSSIFFEKSNNLRKYYGVENDEILIFSPRAITPLYNIDIIIDAVSKLIESGYKIKCMFSFAFGDEYSMQLKKQVQELGIVDHILWLGFLTYEDMSRHYNVADVVVSIPSSDSSPKSVYEAMFCKKPIVVTDLEWSYELLDDCDCIKRVSVRNSDQLCTSLEKIITNPEYSQKLANNALLAAHKYFDYESNMKKMEFIMKKNINK